MQDFQFYHVSSVRMPINGRTFRVVPSDARFRNAATGKHYNSEIDSRNSIIRIYKHLSADLFAAELAMAISEAWRRELGLQSEARPFVYEHERLAAEEMEEFEADLKAAEMKIAMDGWRLPANLPADVRVISHGDGYPPTLIDGRYNFYCHHCGKMYRTSSPLNRHLAKVHGWPCDEDGNIARLETAG